MSGIKIYSFFDLEKEHDDLFSDHGVFARMKPEALAFYHWAYENCPEIGVASQPFVINKAGKIKGLRNEVLNPFWDKLLVTKHPHDTPWRALGGILVFEDDDVAKRELRARYVFATTDKKTIKSAHDFELFDVPASYIFSSSGSHWYNVWEYAGQQGWIRPSVIKWAAKKSDNEGESAKIEVQSMIFSNRYGNKVDIDFDEYSTDKLAQLCGGVYRMSVFAHSHNK